MRSYHVRRSIHGLSAITVAGLLIACSVPSSRTEQLSADLRVRWELLENRPGRNENCQAAFTFTNAGNNLISGNEWNIYFNQNTLIPLPLADSGKGWVEHINGDFYRFVPGKSFRISPGDSLVFTYGYNGIMIKESDAPDGLYIAENSKKKNTPAVSLNHFAVKPFRDIERIFPGFAHLLPSPRTEFLRNLGLKLLTEKETGLIIPTPFKLVPGEGYVEITDASEIIYNKTLKNEAGYLAALIRSVFGAELATREGESGNMNSIVLATADLSINGKESEAYNLHISKDKGIIITGSDAAGVFYGIQTLLGLVNPAGLTGDVPAVQFSAMEIHDAPRFPFRGFLLDVSRNFHSKDTVLKLIDLLSFYKINTLNLRLTDDEGWRLEIDGLPELTEIGSKRGHTLDDALWLPPSFGSGPDPNQAKNMGAGYYSREDFREIIRYARQRHMEIVPEICFPGHARAAIKSMEARYRKYMAQGDEKAAGEFRLIDPDDRSEYYSAQKYKDNIVCVALESAYHFYETVVKDIAAMYSEAGTKLKWFHTGGDEVPQGAWARSPLCIKLMEEHPEIEGPRNLQGYFFSRVVEMLAPYDLIIGGWEEVVLSKESSGSAKVNPSFADRNVIPYVWDNSGDNIDLGYRIANAGYRVVLCNVTNLYFDLAYSIDPTEPGLYWGGFQDAKDPFVLIPFDVFKSAVYDDFGQVADKEGDYSGKEKLKSENRKNILGIQAQLWSETLKRPGMLEYYMLPKLFAFAERAWAAAPAWETDPDLKSRTQKIDKEWNEFANRIGQRELPRLDHLFGGFSYRIPQPGAVMENGLLHVNIAYPGMDVRYTTDGNDPSVGSPLYTGPVSVSRPVRLRAFTSSGRAGKTVEIK